MDDREIGLIESLLPRGEKHAIPAQRLVDLTRFKTVRQLQKQIEAERSRGALILSSSSGGYFLPENKAEIRRFEKTLTRRALSTFRTLRTARAALRVVEGQEVIDV